MPTYTITNAEGRSIKVQGDRPPTPADADALFASAASKPNTKPVAKPSQLKAGMTNFAHHAGNLPMGVGQMAANFAGYVDKKIGGKRDSYLQNNSDTYDQVVEQREKAYQANPAGAKAGGVLPWAGAIAGEALSMLVPETKVAQGAGIGVGIINRAINSAAQAQLAPVEKDESRAARAIGAAALANVLPGGAAVIKGGRNAIKNIKAAPELKAGKEILEKFGLTAADVAKLKPGSTISEAVGGTKAASAEKDIAQTAMGSDAKASFGVRRNQENTAAVQKVAGTAAEQVAAKDARRAATEPFYKANVTNPSKQARHKAAATVLEELSGKGRMPSTDRQLLADAANIVRQSSKGTLDEAEAAKQLAKLKPATRVATLALDDTKAALTQNTARIAHIVKAAGQGVTSQKALASDFIRDIESDIVGGRVSTQTLNNARRALRTKIDDLSKTGKKLSYDEKKYLDGLLNASRASLERAVPGLRATDKTYAKLSGPVNTHKIAQDMLDEMTKNPVTMKLNLAQEGLITQAGLGKYLKKDSRGQFQMLPEGRKQIEAVLTKLKTRTGIEGVNASAGSDTKLKASRAIANGLKSFTKNVGGRGAAAGVGSAVGGLPGAVIGLGIAELVANSAKKRSDKIEALVAEAAFDSAKAKPLIEKALTDATQTERAALAKKYPKLRSIINTTAAGSAARNQ